jgi:hypothetical protein
MLFLRADQTKEALAELEAGLAIVETLSKDHPTNESFTGIVGWLLTNLGEFHIEVGHLPEAQKLLERARGIHERLVNDHPESPGHKAYLAWSLARLGSVHQRARRPAEAASILRRSVELWQLVPNLSPQNHYLVCRTQALLASLAAEPSSPVTAAEAETAADQAIKALRQAIAGGWHDPSRLDKDADLQVLRKRPDFQKLRADMDAQSDP